MSESFRLPHSFLRRVTTTGPRSASGPTVDRIPGKRVARPRGSVSRVRPSHTGSGVPSEGPSPQHCVPTGPEDGSYFPRPLPFCVTRTTP